MRYKIQESSIKVFDFVYRRIGICNLKSPDALLEAEGHKSFYCFTFLYLQFLDTKQDRHRQQKSLKSTIDGAK